MVLYLSFLKKYFLILCQSMIEVPIYLHRYRKQGSGNSHQQIWVVFVRMGKLVIVYQLSSIYIVRFHKGEQ